MCDCEFRVRTGVGSSADPLPEEVVHVNAISEGDTSVKHLEKQLHLLCLVCKVLLSPLPLVFVLLRDL